MSSIWSTRQEDIIASLTRREENNTEEICHLNAAVELFDVFSVVAASFLSLIFVSIIGTQHLQIIHDVFTAVQSCKTLNENLITLNFSLNSKGFGLVELCVSYKLHVCQGDWNIQHSWSPSTYLLSAARGADQNEKTINDKVTL